MSYNDAEYSDEDDAFNEDMESLRRACILTGANPTAVATSSQEDSDDDSADSAEDDIELARDLQKRFSNYANLSGSLAFTPAWSVPLEDDDDVEEDFEALRAIRRRFAAYTDGVVKENTEDSIKRIEQVGKIALEKEASNNLFVKTNINAEEGFPNCVDTNNIATQNLGACSDHVTAELGVACSDCVTPELIELQDSVARNIPTLPLKTAGLPKSALAFVDAIKKNRSCQKAIRSKLMQVQARIEEIKTLKDRVKILKDFQTGCKKRTGRALAQKKDTRVQLISAAKPRPSTKSNDKKTPAMCYGPPENPHASIYQEVLTKFPSAVTREKWSKKEIENLKKGVKQQFQEKLLQQSVDILNDTEEWSNEGSNLDMIVSSVRDYDITPHNMRAFLPKINWEQLASMYIPSRCGMECQSRWLNCEDPLINWNPWTNMEDKNLLHIVQQKGPSNWIDIAVSLGTDRTPFQCLARYQRSLNASIIRREWTKEEDIKIHDAVEEYGQNNWQAVASVMEGRTGTQCSNRWMKSLHPARKRVGKWTPEEDKRLKVAVMIIGPKNWSKIAEFVPGRMQAQCRERWANCLDPSLNFGSWTSEEDLFLEEGIQKHGYCWSKVASCVPHRTDNQCMRRWTMLFPEQVPMLRAVKKTKRAAMISNFVDRESERPAIGPTDFIQFPAIEPPPRLKKTHRRVRRSRKVHSSGDDTSEEMLRLTYGTEGADGQEVTSVTQVRRSSRKRKRKVITDDDSIVTQDSVGMNEKQKLKSNNHKSLPVSKRENPDNSESSYNFTDDAPKRCKSKRSKLKDETCSPENHEAGSDAEITLASFLGRSRGAKKLSHIAVPAETVLASAEVDYTAQVDENASRAKRPKRLSTLGETSYDQMQVEDSGDDLPLSRFASFVGRSCAAKEFSHCAEPAETILTSTEVDCTAQVDENASAAGVSKSKRQKKSSTMEEAPSDHMQVEESGDDLPLSHFCKKLKDPLAIAETISPSAEVDHIAEVDKNAAAGVSRSKRPKRSSTVEEMPSDHMQVEESGDDLPLSHFCKKLKEPLAIAETIAPSAEVDRSAQVDKNASAAGVSRSKRPKRLSMVEETSSGHIQVEESEDDLPLSRFCKKLKDTHAIAESISPSVEVNLSAQVDENASAAGVSRSKKQKRLHAVRETSYDQMQVEESGDDLPLSRLCKKLKDTRAIAEEEAHELTLPYFYKRLKKRKGQPSVKN